MAHRIQHPGVPGDYTYYVRCEAKVMIGGGIRESGCYADSEVPDAFFAAVEQGAQGASFTPARVDGRNVNVLALFTVLFRSEGGERVIAVIPNHGVNVPAFGLGYVAPQRYGGNRFSPRSEIDFVLLTARIDVQGQAKDIKLVNAASGSRETRRYARRYIEGNAFIPGFVDGEPREMRYVKPVFGYRNGYMWMSDHSRCRSATIDCREASSSSGEHRYVFDD